MDLSNIPKRYLIALVATVAIAALLIVGILLKEDTVKESDDTGIMNDIVHNISPDDNISIVDQLKAEYYEITEENFKDSETFTLHEKTWSNMPFYYSANKKFCIVTDMQFDSPPVFSWDDTQVVNGRNEFTLTLHYFVNGEERTHAFQYTGVGCLMLRVYDYGVVIDEYPYGKSVLLFVWS